jgi:hypothetical protein
MRHKQRAESVWFEAVKPIEGVPIDTWPKCQHRHPTSDEATLCASQLGLDWSVTRAMLIRTEAN